MVKKIIDIEGLQKIAGDDTSFVQEILALYAERAQKDIDELRLAEQEHNWSAIQFVVHRMRSAAVPLGMKELLVYLKKIELNLKEDILEDIDNLLKQVYQISEMAIKEALNELKTTSV